MDATVSDAEGRLKTYCKLSMFKFKKIENKALSQIHFFHLFRRTFALLYLNVK